MSCVWRDVAADAVTRELGLGAVCRILQSAAGAQQVADAHVAARVDSRRAP